MGEWVRVKHPAPNTRIFFFLLFVVVVRSSKFDYHTTFILEKWDECKQNIDWLAWARGFALCVNHLVLSRAVRSTDSPTPPPPCQTFGPKRLFWEFGLGWRTWVCLKTKQNKKAWLVLKAHLPTQLHPAPHPLPRQTLAHCIGHGSVQTQSTYRMNTHFCIFKISICMCVFMYTCYLCRYLQ